MSTLAERWIAAIDAAVEISTPAEIADAIQTADAPDDGLRAASYEARTTVGHRGDSHPERLALDDQPGHQVNTRWRATDLRAVSRAGLTFIDSINSLNAWRDKGTVADWDDAISTANVMAELHDGEWITAAVDVSHDLAPYHDTIRAVTSLTELAHRWGCPHVATIQERLAHPDVCLSHARISVERPVHGRLIVCKTCRDHLAEWGDPFAEHRDPEAWPGLEMLRALEDGRKTDYRRLKGEDLAAHGIHPHATAVV